MRRAPAGCHHPLWPIAMTGCCPTLVANPADLVNIPGLPVRLSHGRRTAGRDGALGGRRRGDERSRRSFRRDHGRGHAGLLAGEPVPRWARGDATRRAARQPGIEPIRFVPHHHDPGRGSLPSARGRIPTAPMSSSPAPWTRRSAAAFHRSSLSSSPTAPARRSNGRTGPQAPRLPIRRWRSCKGANSTAIGRAPSSTPRRPEPRRCAGIPSRRDSSSHEPLGCGRCSRTPSPWNRPGRCWRWPGRTSRSPIQAVLGRSSRQANDIFQQRPALGNLPLAGR